MHRGSHDAVVTRGSANSNLAEQPTEAKSRQYKESDHTFIKP